MLKWLKEKAQKAAANQCRLNIGLNVRTLVSVANQADERIHQTGGSNPADINRVGATQHRLLDDIALGLANGLGLQAIESAFDEALAKEKVGNGARMAIDHVLNHVRSELKRAG